MESKFTQHVDREEIVKIVCDLVQQNTVNPPGNEHLCKDIVTGCMKSLGMKSLTSRKSLGARTSSERLAAAGSRSASSRTWT